MGFIFVRVEINFIEEITFHILTLNIKLIEDEQFELGKLLTKAHKLKQELPKTVSSV